MKSEKPFPTASALCTFFGLLALTFIGLTSCSKQQKAEAVSRTISFDDEWRFVKDSIEGAENPEFNDSNWRVLDVPHDWSIEDLPGQNGEDIIGPFDKSAIDKMSSGYLVGGIGWYRKSFTMREEDNDKIAYLQFEGIYMNSDVWLNGKIVGEQNVDME